MKELNSILIRFYNKTRYDMIRSDIESIMKKHPELSQNEILVRILEHGISRFKLFRNRLKETKIEDQELNQGKIEELKKLISIQT